MRGESRHGYGTCGLQMAVGFRKQWNNFVFFLFHEYTSTYPLMSQVIDSFDRP